MDEAPYVYGARGVGHPVTRRHLVRRVPFSEFAAMWRSTPFEDTWNKRAQYRALWKAWQPGDELWLYNDMAVLAGTESLVLIRNGIAVADVVLALS